MEHAGHRQRMFEKLKRGEIFLEQEHLEVLLFPLLPRRNTNDLAHRLLATFGTIYGVFAAPIDELIAVDGVGENIAMHIRCMGMLLEKRFNALTGLYEGCFDSKNFAPYVRERYELETVEVLDVYFLGKKGEILEVHRYTDESENRVKLDVVDFSKSLLKRMPEGVVLVHTHPKSVAKPSAEDDETTKRCQVLCNMHGVLLCDHFIYAPEGIFSYQLAGRMPKASEYYTMKESEEN